MTNQELLEQALHSGAIIHQPHSLKAYLSANYLAEYLGKGEAILSHTSKLMVNQYKPHSYQNFAFIESWSVVFILRDRGKSTGHFNLLAKI